MLVPVETRAEAYLLNELDQSSIGNYKSPRLFTQIRAVVVLPT